MRLRFIFSILGFLLLLFIGLPILRMLLSATPRTLTDTMQDPEVFMSIFLTLRASLWATLLAMLTGIPLAYLLVRKNFFGKKFIEGLIDVPVIIPHTAAGIALLTIWGRQSFLSKIFGMNIVGTEIAISMAMFFVSVPFLINGAKAGFKSVDERYEKTALTLGASPWKVFRGVTLPLAKKSIISGSIMMWGRGISEFGAVIILAYHPMVAPVLIYERFQNFGLNHALPLTVLLVIITLMVFVFLRTWEDR